MNFSALWQGNRRSRVLAAASTSGTLYPVNCQDISQFASSSPAVLTHCGLSLVVSAASGTVFSSSVPGPSGCAYSRGPWPDQWSPAPNAEAFPSDQCPACIADHAHQLKQRSRQDSCFWLIDCCLNTGERPVAINGIHNIHECIRAAADLLLGAGHASRARLRSMLSCTEEAHAAC